MWYVTSRKIVFWGYRPTARSDHPYLSLSLITVVVMSWEIGCTPIFDHFKISCWVSPTRRLRSSKHKGTTCHKGVSGKDKKRCKAHWVQLTSNKKASWHHRTLQTIIRLYQTRLATIMDSDCWVRYVLNTTLMSNSDYCYPHLKTSSVKLTQCKSDTAKYLPTWFRSA